MIAYKVLRNVNGKLYSTNWSLNPDCISIYMKIGVVVEYIPEQITLPSFEESKLFVFKDEQSAINHADHTNTFEIWKTEIPDDSKELIQQDYPYVLLEFDFPLKSENLFKTCWSKGQILRQASSFYKADNTLLADQVKLIKRMS